MTSNARVKAAQAEKVAVVDVYTTAEDAATAVVAVLARREFVSEAALDYATIETTRA